MSEFAFRSKVTKSYIKGKLEVEANKDSRMGVSDRHVPKGSIGYVSGTGGLGGKGDPNRWIVHWPDISKDGKTDQREGVHDKNDLTPTGKRG